MRELTNSSLLEGTLPPLLILDKYEASKFNAFASSRTFILKVLINMFKLILTISKSILELSTTQLNSS